MRLIGLAVCLVLGCALVPLAAETQQAWDRQAVYAAHEAQLKQAIERRPADPQPLVDLAAFYLKPVAPRDVEAADGVRRRVMVPLRNEWIVEGIKEIYAVPWVFRGDPDLARPLLKRALELDPKHPRAIRESAMLLRMKSNLDGMRPYMEAALRRDPLDLDMCRLHLDHRTAGARVLNDQAVDLRTPRIWEEQRADGRYRVTRQPSPADYARADELDKRAQQARREAVQPLQNLARMLKNDPQRETDPSKKSKWNLATAVYHHWLGELEKSAGSANAALRADPTSLDALDFLVDITRGTHTKDKLATYKGILDRWAGADTTPVALKPRTMGPKR
jgi:tetratricopeptide (TPR) repeat protein